MGNCCSAKEEEVVLEVTPKDQAGTAALRTSHAEPSHSEGRSAQFGLEDSLGRNYQKAMHRLHVGNARDAPAEVRRYLGFDYVYILGRGASGAAHLLQSTAASSPVGRFGFALARALGVSPREQREQVVCKVVNL